MENYFVFDLGFGCVMMLWLVCWDYFYDEIGWSMVGFVWWLFVLWCGVLEFWNGVYYFYNDWVCY